MPTIGKNQLPYPNTSDEPNVPWDLQKLAQAIDKAIETNLSSLDKPVTSFDAGNGQGYSWWCRNRVVTINATWNRAAGPWDEGGMFWIPTQYTPPVTMYFPFVKDGVPGDSGSMMRITADGHVMWQNRGGQQHVGLGIATGSYVIP